MTLIRTRANDKDVCSKKVAHKFKYEAEKQLKRLKSRGRIAMHVYRCEDHWHVGHKPGRSRKRNTDAW